MKIDRYNLNSCPICKTSDYLHVRVEFTPRDIEQVICTNCGMRGPETAALTSAVMMWNGIPYKTSEKNSSEPEEATHGHERMKEICIRSTVARGLSVGGIQDLATELLAVRKELARLLGQVESLSAPVSSEEKNKAFRTIRDAPSGNHLSCAASVLTDFIANRTAQGDYLPRKVNLLIGKVRPSADGSWNVSIAPDNETWLTVWPEDVSQAPSAGDIITVVPPRVISLFPADRAAMSGERGKE